MAKQRSGSKGGTPRLRVVEDNMVVVVSLKVKGPRRHLKGMVKKELKASIQNDLENELPDGVEIEYFGITEL